MRQMICAFVEPLEPQLQHAPLLKPVYQDHVCAEQLQDVRRVKPATQTAIRVHNSTPPIQIFIYKNQDVSSKIKETIDKTSLLHA